MVPMSRRGRPLLSWQLGCKVPGGGGERGGCETSSPSGSTAPLLPTFPQSPPGIEQHVPEKVPEKTPGAWLTKLSMTAPGLRDRAEGAGLLPGELLLREPQSTWEGRNMASALGRGVVGHTTLLLTLCHSAKSQVRRAQTGSRCSRHQSRFFLACKEPPWGPNNLSAALCEGEQEAAAAAPAHPWGQAG